MAHLSATEVTARTHYLWFEKRSNAPRFIVGIYEPLVDRLGDVFRLHRDIEQYMDTFEFLTYDKNLRGTFGFHASMKYIRTKDRYVQLSLPLVRSRRINCVTATILFLLDTLGKLPTLESVELIADAKKEQLMILRGMLTKADFMCGAIEGWTSPAFNEWVRKIGSSNDVQHKIKEAMFAARNAVAAFPAYPDPSSPNPFMPCEMMVREDRFILDTATACGISTMGIFPRPEDNGWLQIVSSNMDSATRTIIALAGLGQMHAMFDRGAA